MKFFTPDLFIRFNSPDDEAADLADEDWEAAIRAYRGHLEGLRGRMPAQVERLAGLRLHDAELLAVEQPTEPSSLPPFAILSVKQGDEIVSLIYVLRDRMRRHEPEMDWPFSKSRVHWLYDEIDIDPNHGSGFLHRVLLSDGAVIEVPFVSALIHRVPLPEGRPGDAPRQIA